MEIRKVSINDYRDDMGIIRSYSADSEDIKHSKEFYYTQAVAQLENFRAGIEILRQDENHNILLFKVNEDMKFQLTLTNCIKYLSIDLQLYQKNNRFEDILSNEYHYHCEADSEHNYTDVEEKLEYDRVGQHFRHMLVMLVKKIAKIEE